METFTNAEDNALASGHAARLAGRNESEWQAYRLSCQQMAERGDVCLRELIALKRASALAYLGKRSQNEGGVYSKTQLRILTPEFVQVMAKTNTAQRFMRYPWLERLLGLIDEINQVQDQISLRGNVLPFTGPKTPLM